MIMSVEAFRTDVIVFIGDIMMCFTSDWPINLCMRVTNWPNIFVDQSQFSDPDFISGTYQRENVQFANKYIISICKSPQTIYYRPSLLFSFMTILLFCLDTSKDTWPWTDQKTLDRGQIKRFLTILISRHDSFLSTFINLFPWHLSSCFSIIVINRSSS
jgi:hypothetical protein